MAEQETLSSRTCCSQRPRLHEHWRSAGPQHTAGDAQLSQGAVLQRAQHQRIVAARRLMVDVEDTHRLPVRRFAQDITRAVRENDVIVVLAETGSGKTTQIPQVHNAPPRGHVWHCA